MTQNRRSGLSSIKKRLLLSGLGLLALSGSALAQGDPDITALGFSWVASPVTGHVYYLTGQTGSWINMEARSHIIGAHLVAINDVAEDNLVTTLVGNTTVVWIGLYQSPAGGTNEPGLNWKWSNGEALGYTNWCSSSIQEPDDWHGDQNFGVIHSDVSRTNGVSGSCWDDAHNFEVPGVTPPVSNDIQGIVEVVPCSTTTASITGNIPITLGFGAQTDQLNILANLNNSNLTFSWTGANTANLSCTGCANPVFTPSGANTYKYNVFISDELNHCMVKVKASITVTDIVDPSDKTKVLICHTQSNTPMTKSVAPAAVQAHLNHGDYLGPCIGQGLHRVVMNNESSDVKVYPNPSQNTFVVDVPHSDEAATVVLRDMQGRVLETRNVNANEDHQLRFDLQSSPRGVYFIEGLFGAQSFHTKVVLQ
jgi:hypothetical protein